MTNPHAGIMPIRRTIKLISLLRWRGDIGKGLFLKETLRKTKAKTTLYNNTKKLQANSKKNCNILLSSKICKYYNFCHLHLLKSSKELTKVFVDNGAVGCNVRLYHSLVSPIFPLSKAYFSELV